MIDIELSRLDELDKEIDEAIQKVQLEAAKELSKIGEEFITESREKGSYKDQTGNLRNANSYAVYLDGIPLYHVYGRPETQAFFDRLKDGSGLEFICGNPMEYCSFVESRGFNVVSSGFLKVISRVSEVFGI